MASLVPYAPRALAFGRVGTRYGVRLARMGRRYVRGAARAGRTYRGSAGLGAGSYAARRRRRPSNRGRKSELRRRIGERVGTGVAKRHESTTAGALATRTLYIQPLLNIPKGTTIDSRERGVVNFRGMKFCHRFFMRSPSVLEPNQVLYLNRAIVSPKGCDTDPLTTNFFRGDGATRAVDFSVALTSTEFKCLPINTDKLNVHMHKRETLGPYNSSEGRGQKFKMWYTKLARQIRYDDDGEVPTGKQMYYVWWLDFNNAASGGAPITGFCEHDYRMVAYFREPRQ